MFGEDVVIIGVGGRGTDSGIMRFVEQGGVGGFEHAIDDEDLTIWRSFGVSSQPAFAFLNDDGTFEAHVGALGAEGIASRLEALIAS